MKPARAAGPGRAASMPSPQRDVDVRSANDEDDPYNARSKPPEPTACPKCHATFVHGRWSWDKAPKDAHSQVCPACQRIQDRFPAGYVTIKGAFFAEHRDEMVQFIESHGKREKQAHPLQRIMGMDDKKDGLEITTTDSLLARGIAEALVEAYKGDLKLRYSRDENLVRAIWKR